jgi:hypothetical protein
MDGSGAAVAKAEGGLWAGRLTAVVPWKALPPALAETTRVLLPLVAGGGVITSRICDPNACAATVTAAETKAAETAALLAAAETLPWPAAERLANTEPWVSVVLNPTTCARAPEADRAATVWARV